MTIAGYNTAHLLFMILVSFRMGAFFMSSPIGSYVTVPYIMVLLSLSLGFLLGPVIPHQLPDQFGLEAAPFFYAILTEILVGVLMGFALSLIFMLANIAGEFAGVQMGFSMASLFDPSLGQIPLLAFFYRIFLVLAFFMLDLHHDLIRVLVKTYETIPPGASLFSFSSLIPALMQLFTSIFLLALRLGLPIVAVILLMNVTVGIVTMTAPQMNFYFNVSFIVNIMIGMMLVALGFITLMRYFETGMGSLYQFLNLFFV